MQILYLKHYFLIRFKRPLFIQVMFFDYFSAMIWSGRAGAGRTIRFYHLKKKFNQQWPILKLVRYLLFGITDLVGLDGTYRTIFACVFFVFFKIKKKILEVGKLESYNRSSSSTSPDRYRNKLFLK